MEAMRDVGVKRVVFISSGAVYGEQKNQPVSEKSIPIPTSPYPNCRLNITCRPLARCGRSRRSSCACSTPMAPANTSRPRMPPWLPASCGRPPEMARW
jgi:hypothetical protein